MLYDGTERRHIELTGAKAKGTASAIDGSARQSKLMFTCSDPDILNL